MELKDIAARFDLRGTGVKSVTPLGEGLINDTYVVEVEGDDTRYIMQRINNAIFTDVEGLQRNIEAVTRHLRRKLEARGVTDIERRVLTPVKLKDSDATYTEANGKFWRVTLFIPGSHTISRVTPETARITGEAFGRFEADLADIKEPLIETIPGFHDMEWRVRQLREAVEADTADRLRNCQDLVDDLLRRADDVSRPQRDLRAGRLTKRICHCDTKVNNMLFDEDGNLLCVIDLDTVMPSLVSSDYGDFLRTAANTRPEDEPDLDLIELDMEVIRAFTEGYLKGATFLTPAEKALLPKAIAMFPYMQAVRFLTDYLNGDTYYKTAYPEHNLVRTRAQHRLLQLIEAQAPALNALIN